MACLKDLAPCKSDGSLGGCCSNFCLQNENEAVGFCQSSSPQMGKSKKCLEDGSRCKPDGSLGDCCSFYCEKLGDDEYGTCKGSSPPTGVPEGCLKEGEECKTDASLGFCCYNYCKVLKPHTKGICQAQSVNPISIFTSSSWIIYISISVAAASILIIMAFVWLYWRQRKLEAVMSPSEADMFFQGDPETIDTSGYAHEISYSFPYNMELEISECDFFVDWQNPLGKGNYGLVLKGKINGMITVAAKTVRKNQTTTVRDGSYLRALLGEIKVLQYLGTHENIVSMIGCHTSNIQTGSVFLFLEYCPIGSLEKFLKDHKQNFLKNQERPHSSVELPAQQSEYSEIASYSFEFTQIDLLNYCMQITNAMVYLEEKKVIHADIATRNILLLRKDYAKLADFGLSRRLNEFGVYMKKNQDQLPWRWMALESLEKMSFSHKSDVWSLGITFWEIYSLGGVPYPGLTWNSAFVNDLKNNLKPTKPPTATDELYTLMLDCWKLESDSRPRFTEIYSRLYGFKYDYSAIVPCTESVSTS